MMNQTHTNPSLSDQLLERGVLTPLSEHKLKILGNFTRAYTTTISGIPTTGGSFGIANNVYETHNFLWEEVSGKLSGQSTFYQQMPAGDVDFSVLIGNRLKTVLLPLVASYIASGDKSFPQLEYAVKAMFDNPVSMSQAQLPYYPVSKATISGFLEHGMLHKIIRNPAQFVGCDVTQIEESYIEEHIYGNTGDQKVFLHNQRPSYTTLNGQRYEKIIAIQPRMSDLINMGGLAPKVRFIILDETLRVIERKLEQTPEAERTPFFQGVTQQHLPTLNGILDVLPLEAQKALQYLTENPNHSLAAFSEATGIAIPPQTQHSLALDSEQASNEIQKHVLQFQLSALDQKIADHIRQISSGDTNPQTAETLQKLLKVKHLLKKKKIILASS